MIDYEKVARQLLGLTLAEPNEAGWCNGRCPLHQDHSPSFGINILNGVYTCFVCGSGSFNDLATQLGVEVSTYQHCTIDDPDLIINKIKSAETTRLRNAETAINIALWARNNRKRLGDEAVEEHLRRYDDLTLLDPAQATREALYVYQL